MKLLIIWLWFTAQLVPRPCLDIPDMREAAVFPSGSQALGLYTAHPEAVWIREGLPPSLRRLVTVHEFAHHYWQTCRVAERPVGRRFLRAVGADSWTRQAAEEWAVTFTWVLTGEAGGSPYLRRRAAYVFAGLIETPDAGQAARLAWGR